MSDRDDPFGRRGEERSDPFGREAAPSDSLWSGPAEDAAPAEEEPRAKQPPSGFLPPTDATPESSSWWADPSAEQAPARPASQEPARAPAQQPAWQGPSGAAMAPPPRTMPDGVETAAYMERVGAAAIDLLIRIVLAAVLVFGTALTGSEDAVAVMFFVSLWVIVPFYAPLMMSRWDGQTVGHRAVGTRVVTVKGAPVTGGKAVVREVAVKNFLIELVGSFLSLGILPLVNYLWPLWDDRDETLHDKMCDTRVVKA